MSFERYTIYSGKATTVAIAVSLLATYLGGGATMGMISLSYKGGAALLGPNLGVALGLVVIALLVPKILAIRDKYKIVRLEHV